MRKVTSTLTITASGTVVAYGKGRGSVVLGSLFRCPDGTWQTGGGGPCRPTAEGAARDLVHEIGPLWLRNPVVVANALDGGG